VLRWVVLGSRGHTWLYLLEPLAGPGTYQLLGAAVGVWELLRSSLFQPWNGV
jgi:hypothetical protein